MCHLLAVGRELLLEAPHERRVFLQDPAILGQIGEFLEVCRLRAELGPTAVINWLNKDFEMGRPYDILVEYPITP